ncbi:MAG: hypothetical protein R6X12_03345 [bacterium]
MSRPGPPVFDLTPGLVGVDRACGAIHAFLAAGPIPSLLLAGPQGVGKRTVAIRLAQAANCRASSFRPCGQCASCRSIAALKHPDARLLFPARRGSRAGGAESDTADGTLAAIAEDTPDYLPGRPAPLVEAGQVIPIALIRWLRGETSRPPFSAPCRCFIILHAERMTTEAANAFLKMLEEPQRATAFILTTSNPGMLLDTIRSRCRIIRFPAVPVTQVREWLGNRVPPDQAALAAELSDGSPGRALRFLDNPEDYLAPAAVEFLTHPRPDDKLVFETMSRLGDVPLATVTCSFLFVLSQLLRARHGISTSFAAASPGLAGLARAFPDDYLRRAIRYLTERLDETRFNTNRRLFLYTLLASLRRPS